MRWQWFFCLVVTLDIFFISLVAFTPPSCTNTALSVQTNTSTADSPPPESFSHDHIVHIKISCAFAITLTILTVTQFISCPPLPANLSLSSCHSQQAQKSTNSSSAPAPNNNQQNNNNNNNNNNNPTPGSSCSSLPSSSGKPDLMRTFSNSSTNDNDGSGISIPRDKVPDRFRPVFYQYEKVRARKNDPRVAEIAKRWLLAGENLQPSVKEAKLIAKHITRVEKQNQGLVTVVDNLIGEIARDIGPNALEQVSSAVATLQEAPAITTASCHTETRENLLRLKQQVRSLQQDLIQVRQATCKDLGLLSSLVHTSLQLICRFIARRILSSASSTHNNNNNNNNTFSPTPTNSSSLIHSSSSSTTSHSRSHRQPSLRSRSSRDYNNYTTTNNNNNNTPQTAAALAQVRSTVPAIRQALSSLRMDVAVVVGWFRGVVLDMVRVVQHLKSHTMVHQQQWRQMESACQRIFELQQQLEVQVGNRKSSDGVVGGSGSDGGASSSSANVKRTTLQK